MTLEEIDISAWNVCLSDTDDKNDENTHAAENLLNIPLQPTFLRLPQEIRDMIYEYYVWKDGGLFYNSRTDILRTPDGQPPEASLARTCTQIAHEIKDLVLKVNPVTFSTEYDATTCHTAELFHTAMRALAEEKSEVVNKMTPHLLTSDNPNSIALLYPQFQPILDHWATGRQLHTQEWLGALYGEAASFKRDFVHTVLNYITPHPDFRRLASVKHVSRGPNHTLELNLLHPQPWSIFQHSEVRKLANEVRMQHPDNFHYDGNTEFVYSAASVAIKFLHSRSPAQLRSMRKVILLEDHEAVAHPESHARGLVSYCQQYKNIRIERRVSLWKCILPVRNDWLLPMEKYVYSSMVTNAVGLWLAEAMILPSLDIPNGSFSLVVDGGPTTEASSKVFDIVLRDTSWQRVMDESLDQGLLPSRRWLERRLRIGYLFESLPQAIDILVAKKKNALLCCGFSIGSMPDVSSLVERHSGWTPEHWAATWSSHHPSRFETELPLPSWWELKIRNIIPRTIKY
jgi:hypothetical protein